MLSCCTSTPQRLCRKSSCRAIAFHDVFTVFGSGISSFVCASERQLMSAKDREYHVAPFTNRELLDDSRFDFLFQFRGRRLGRVTSPSPHSQTKVILPQISSSTLEASKSSIFSSKSFRRKSTAIGLVSPTVSVRPYSRITASTTAQLPHLLDACERRVEAEIREERDLAMRSHSPAHAAQYVISLSKPQPPRSEKQRKMFLRNLFCWAIGRIMSHVRSSRTSTVEAARHLLDQLKREKATRKAQEESAKRCEMAQAFFEDVLRRFRGGRHRSAQLTQAKYLQVKETFRFICSNEEMVLSLKEMQSLLEKSGRPLDPMIFKKLDRDHSGYLDLSELLHAMYPGHPLRELNALIAKWTRDEGIRTAHSREAADSVALLSAESRETIGNIFRLCDKGHKGVLTKSDLEIIAPHPNFDSGEFFPTPTSVISLSDFTELMKWGFPPFSGKNFTMEKLDGVEKKRTLPTDLLDAQEKATSSM